MKQCYSCFKEYGEAYNVCPYCGTEEIKTGKEPIHLTPGTVLNNRYVIGKSIGAGGFGIVYKAWDRKFENIVAIKEFFVPRLTTRAGGLKNVIVSKKTQVEFEYRLKRFLAEARTMAKFGGHRSIPNVFEFFEENNTAYIVMEFLQGMTLSEYIKQLKGKISVDFAVTIGIEIAEALKSLHAKGIVHRDVAPDNIYICGGKNIRLKLMDLGSAKLVDETDDVIDIILKPGYSPVEQYDKAKNIGPWTDIYALGATIYAAVTGFKPEESTDRKEKDTVVEPIELNPEISENLNNTIMKAMAIESHMRFKNTDEFIEALNGDRKVIPVHTEKKRRRLKRNLGVAAAVLVVVVSGLALFGKYMSDKNAAVLPSGEIVVWCCEEKTDDFAGNALSDADVMNNIAANFKQICQEQMVNVNVDVEVFSEDEYKDKLIEAYNNGEMPDLFESTCLSEDEVQAYGISLENIKSRKEFPEFLAENNVSDYRIPLSVEVPVAYINEGIYDGDYSYYSCESCAGSIDEFSEGTASSYIGTTTEYNKTSYSSGVAGFPLGLVFPDDEGINCEFTNYWSMSGSEDADKIRLAEELLSNMVSNPDYQKKVNTANVPVVEDVLPEFFGDIQNRYDEFIFY